METVTSADGTAIAYDRVGEGPVLIVCVGAFCTRATFVAPDDLARQFTVVTYDRRGRGDSGGGGDAGPVAAEREHEDLAAVAAATWTGAPFVFGHSSGAAIALRATAAGLPFARVVAYEAPFGNDDAPVPAVDPDERIRELVGAGRDREAVVFWMTEVVRLPGQTQADLDRAAWVTALAPLAGTLPYDLAVTAGGVPDPRRQRQPRLVPPVGRRAGRRHARRAAEDAGRVRPQHAGRGHRPDPDGVLHSPAGLAPRPVSYAVRSPRRPAPPSPPGRA